MLNTVKFFFTFIILLAVILLGLSFGLGRHAPDSKKNKPFECGYLSFIYQNRIEFTISFFIFGLLYLLFDLEILLVQPYVVSSYNNSFFGLIVLLIFLLLLAAGFVFELGKGALSIESKQTTYLRDSTVKMNVQKVKGNLSMGWGARR